jgi:hypothetical protein
VIQASDHCSIGDVNILLHFTWAEFWIHLLAPVHFMEFSDAHALKAGERRDQHHYIAPQTQQLLICRKALLNHPERQGQHLNSCRYRPRIVTSNRSERPLSTIVGIFTRMFWWLLDFQSPDRFVCIRVDMSNLSLLMMILDYFIVELTSENAGHSRRE